MTLLVNDVSGLATLLQRDCLDQPVKGVGEVERLRIDGQADGLVEILGPGDCRHDAAAINASYPIVVVVGEHVAVGVAVRSGPVDRAR